MSFISYIFLYIAVVLLGAFNFYMAIRHVEQKKLFFAGIYIFYSIAYLLIFIKFYV